MKFFPLIILIAILTVIILTVLIMNFQSNPAKIDITRQPETVTLEKEEIPGCPDSVTEIRTIFHCGAMWVERDFEIISTKGMKKCMLTIENIILCNQARTLL